MILNWPSYIFHLGLIKRILTRVRSLEWAVIIHLDDRDGDGNDDDDGEDDDDDIENDNEDTDDSAQKMCSILENSF